MMPTTFLASIRDAAGAWFSGYTLDSLGSTAHLGDPIFSDRDSRVLLDDLSIAEDEASCLLGHGCDVAIVCEAFPSLGL